MNTVRMMLSREGFATFRTNVGKVKTADGRWFDTGLPRGFSDILAIKDGKAFFVETKVEPNKPTLDQIKFLKIMRDRYGCSGGVAYTLEEARIICQLMN